MKNRDARIKTYTIKRDSHLCMKYAIEEIEQRISWR